jgi:hypothetical protein
VGYDETCVFPRGFNVCVVTRDGQVIVRVELHDSARAETMPLEPHEARTIAGLLCGATECDTPTAESERDRLRRELVALREQLAQGRESNARVTLAICARDCYARIDAILRGES